MPGKGKPGGYNIKWKSQLQTLDYILYRRSIEDIEYDNKSLQSQDNYWREDQTNITDRYSPCK